MNFLTQFDCGYNNLSGIIPSFESNNNLEILALQYNQLSGSIPSLSLKKLIYVNVIGNNLVGAIPPNLGSKNNTQFIYLGSSTGKNHRFGGSISDNYCTYQNLLSFSMPSTDSKSTCYPSCLYLSLNADYLSTAIRCPGKEDEAICGLIESIGIAKINGGSTNGVTTYYDSSHPLTKSQYFIINDPNVNKYEIKLYGKCKIETSRVINICSLIGIDTLCSKLSCGNTTKVVISGSGFAVNYTQSTGGSYFGFTLSVTSYAKVSLISCDTPPSLSSEKSLSLQLIRNHQKVSNYASNLCSWSQVKCLHGQVISISLHGLGLTGFISESIQYLTSLQTLDLGSNSLYGTIPNSLGLLKNLITVDLSSNNLNGTVPIQLTILPQLTNLILSKNSFTGPIMTNISSSLRLVDLSNNLLNGQVPGVLGSYTSTKFNFQGNINVGCFQPNPSSNNSVKLVSPLPECTPTNSPTQHPTISIDSPASPTVNSALIGSIVGPVGFVLVMIGLYFYRRQQLKSQAKNEIKQAKKSRLDLLPIHKSLTGFYDLRSNIDLNENGNETNNNTDGLDESKNLETIAHNDNPLRNSKTQAQRRNSISIYQRRYSGVTLAGNDPVINVIKAIEENINTVNEMDYDGETAIDICLKNYDINEKVTDEIFIYKILREAIVSDIDESGHLLVSQVSRYGPIWIKITNSTLNLTDVVARILDEFPKFSRNLADTCDHVGRTVLQLAVPEVAKLIIQSINLFRRYDINRQPHHKSATSSIHLGSDYEDGITGHTKVALKFMSNKKQFLSELQARENAELDQQYVVGIMDKFDSDEDEFVRSQLETFGFSQYPYVLVEIYFYHCMVIIYFLFLR